VGTRIEVTHLFNSVPARRKFLKTDQTEAAHIVQCVRLYALACPRTSFTLIEDGRVVFRSPECATLAERVAEIFGRQTAEALVPIDAAEERHAACSGLIGRPGVGRSTRHEMIVFVNQRPVDSRTLNYALIESYHESLPKGRYPLAFVFFECDPACGRRQRAPGEARSALPQRAAGAGLRDPRGAAASARARRPCRPRLPLRRAAGVVVRPAAGIRRPASAADERRCTPTPAFSRPPPHRPFVVLTGFADPHLRNRPAAPSVPAPRPPRSPAFREISNRKSPLAFPRPRAWQLRAV
jgi:hypothetical protein